MNITLVVPITVKPLVRPRYDNINYTSYDAWVRDNLDKLEPYFAAQGEYLDDEPPADFGRWCAVQHDLEEQRAAWDLVDQL
jgi:hypothetical protein